MKIPNVKVVEVTAIGPGLLHLSWDDGVTRDVDVSKWLAKHPLLEALNDQDRFRDVQVIANGGGVEFGNGVDFCAHSLRLLSDEQSLPKTRKTA
jgi:hypothetical protein